MIAVAEKIKTEALRLSDADRAALAHALLESLDGDADPGAEAAWDAELERRLATIESGQATGRPAEEVFARIRARHAPGWPPGWFEATAGAIDDPSFVR